jgi:hypothetical protein
MPNPTSSSLLSTIAQKKCKIPFPGYQYNKMSSVNLNYLPVNYCDVFLNLIIPIIEKNIPVIKPPHQ